MRACCSHHSGWHCSGSWCLLLHVAVKCRLAASMAIIDFKHPVMWFSFSTSIVANHGIDRQFVCLFMMIRLCSSLSVLLSGILSNAIRNAKQAHTKTFYKVISNTMQLSQLGVKLYELDLPTS